MKFIRQNLSLLFLVIFIACTEKEVLVLNDCMKYFLTYESHPTDPIYLKSAEINGDCLKLVLQYAGGCTTHQIDLARITPKCGTPPLPPVTFEIRHDAKGDGCKALIMKELSFDISGIRESGKTQVDFILRTNTSGGTNEMTLTYKY